MGASSVFLFGGGGGAGCLPVRPPRKFWLPPLHLVDKGNVNCGFHEIFNLST